MLTHDRTDLQMNSKDRQFEKLLRTAFNLFKRQPSSRIKAKRKKHGNAA